MDKGILIWAIAILIAIAFFLIYTLSTIDKDECFEASVKAGITRCEKINYVPTLNPFEKSTKCYCENTDRIYFDKLNYTEAK